MRAALLVLLLLAACTKSAAPTPRQIRIVGAAAGLPFAADVAERFTRASPDTIAPLAQAGGNAVGIAQLCGGLGADYPQIAIVTRPMTAVESAACAAHKAGPIAAIPFGWSALVAVTAADGPALAPTRADLDRAFAGRDATWADVDQRLPPVALSLHGLAGDGGLGGGARRDGRYVAHGADAALIADAVAKAPGSIGLMPYAQAIATPLRRLPVDGVAPTPATIASGRYPIALPLVVLVKRRELAQVPGMAALLAIFARSIGPDGPLAAKGLVPLAPPHASEATAEIAAAARL